MATDADLGSHAQVASVRHPAATCPALLRVCLEPAACGPVARFATDAFGHPRIGRRGIERRMTTRAAGVEKPEILRLVNFGHSVESAIDGQRLHTQQRLKCPCMRIVSDPNAVRALPGLVGPLPPVATGCQ